jgi:threonine dehydratase
VTGDTKAPLSSAGSVTRDDIRRAYDTIRPYLRRTPVIQAELPGVSGPVTLKLELMQCAGSFKARGVFTNLLLRELPAAGVVAASGGNHGVAVAYAAQRLNVPAKIFVPTVSNPGKIQRIKDLGADLVVGGDRYSGWNRRAPRPSATPAPRASRSTHRPAASP